MADNVASVGDEPEQQPPPPDTTEERHWIVHGSVLKAIWKLAVPTMVSAFLHNVFMLTDMFWVGKLGKTALASVGTAGVLLGLAFMLALGISIGTSAMVARFVGEKKDAHRVLAQSLLMALANATLVAVVGLVFAEKLLALMNAGEDIIELAAIYLRISVVGTYIIYTGLTLNSALRASGDAITPLIVLAVANVLNVLLDPLFIFGWGGFPRFGVAGSAVATVLSHAIGVSITVTLVFRTRKVNFRLNIKDLVPDLAMMWRIFRIGVFSSAQGLVRHISSVLLVSIVLGFGKAAMAAFTVGIRVWFSALMPAIGFGMAAATLVGQNLGADQPERAAKSAWMAAGTYAVFGVVLGGLVALFPDALVGIFDDDPAVITVARTLMQISGGTLVFVSFSIVLSRAMQGAGDTLSPLVITACTFLLIRVPLAYWLSARWNSVNGVWAAMGATNVVTGLIMCGWFALGRWKHKRV